MKIDTGNTLKRLRNRYRLVVMNDDTYEEVVTFKLSRMSVYIMVSSIFILLVGLTVALIVFTPLKYYIPGTGLDYRSSREAKMLKYKTDSLDKQLFYNEQYMESIKKVLEGDTDTILDTTTVEVPKEEYIGN